MNRMSTYLQFGGNLLLRESGQKQIEDAALRGGQGKFKGRRHCQTRLPRMIRVESLNLLLNVASGEPPNDESHAAKSYLLTKFNLTRLDWLVVDEGSVPTIQVANRHGGSVNHQFGVSPRHGRIVEDDIAIDGSTDDVNSLFELDADGRFGIRSLQ
jgi:hypothetical protein